MYNYLKLQIILFLLGLYRRQLDVFQFLEDVSRSCRLLNSVWTCPYRVVKVTCGLCQDTVLKLINDPPNFW